MNYGAGSTRNLFENTKIIPASCLSRKYLMHYIRALIVASKAVNCGFKLFLCSSRTTTHNCSNIKYIYSINNNWKVTGIKA